MSTVTIGGRKHPRVRSMSMSVAVADPVGQQWLNRMAQKPRYRVFFKTSDFAKADPSRVHVFVDEHPDSINNGAFGVWMSDGPVKTYIFDYPASFHNGACGFSFADGHTEIHKWVDKRTQPKPTYTAELALGVTTPNNRDMVWLSEHTSVPE